MSTARFIHTADWQLGKPFARVTDPRKRSLLQNERLAALHRIAAAVADARAEFVLVAGDLFDSPNADKATVSAACAAIGSMRVPVLIIPGNHDHAGPGSLWEQDFFQREQRDLAPNLRVCLSPEPVELPTALVLPCPLRRRHESADPTAWIRTGPGSGSGKPRIVLAHGTVQDFGSGAAAGPDADADGDSGDPEGAGVANFLDLSRLPQDELDYLALGDWHGMKQVGPKAWYSGTPELDRFLKGEDHRPGHVLLVSATRGSAPQVEAIPTSGIGWHQITFDIAGDDALPELRRRMEECVGSRVDRDVVRLELTGSLGIGAAQALDGWIETCEARLLRLKRYDHTRIAPSAEEIDALTRRAADPLISRVAARLVERVREGGENGAVAALALRELHALCS